ncbi:MD-2-related lipid-recognition domain [Dillenia turbinata]|uniref:MD-2-related lipid-recognition domain n=1 Tax=Dillenia turbinata TaxID=194707 RepID=A0AAN8UMC9_9MAGN
MVADRNNSDSDFKWASLQQKLNTFSRFSWLFFDGRSQDLSFIKGVQLRVQISFLMKSQISDIVFHVDKSTSYDVKVQGVEISSNLVARGKPATFSISASTNKAISGWKLVIDVSSFGVHIHTRTCDLCSETSCPVSAGDFLIAHSQILPGFTPPVSHRT